MTELYVYILAVICVATILLSFFSKEKGDINTVLCFTFFLVTIHIVLSYSRDIKSDTVRYLAYYNDYMSNGLEKLMNFSDPFNIGFRFYNYILASLNFSNELFIATTSFFIVFLIYLSCRSLMSKYNWLLAIALYSIYPYTLLYSYSGLRQGLAMGFACIAISKLLTKSKLWVVFLFLILAISFHHSAIIYLSIIFMLFSPLKVKWYFVAFAFINLISATGLNELILNRFLNADFFGTREAIYFSNDVNYRTGFRLDFVLFSFLPLFFYLYDRGVSGFSLAFSQSDNIMKIICLYMLLNSVGLLLNFMPFNDRFFALSWILIPMMLGLMCEYKLRLSKIAYVSYLLCCSILFITYSSMWFFLDK